MDEDNHARRRAEAVRVAVLHLVFRRRKRVVRCQGNNGNYYYYHSNESFHTVLTPYLSCLSLRLSFFAYLSLCVGESMCMYQCFCVRVSVCSLMLCKPLPINVGTTSTFLHNVLQQVKLSLNGDVVNDKVASLK